MKYIIGCLVLCCSLVNSQPVPFPAAAVPGVAPGVAGAGVVNPALGLNPYNRNPLAAGYNSPYYNPASASVPIVQYSNNRGPDGSYSYSYASADGKQAQETGFLKDAFIDVAGNPQGTQVVEGSYSYISPEGTPIQVNYVADENGFRPSGVHIPADGKGALPLPIANGIGDKLNPFNNRFNPYNPYNGNGFLGQYNNPLGAYDPRYQFNPGFNPYNPYNGPGKNDVKADPKKIV